MQKTFGIVFCLLALKAIAFVPPSDFVIAEMAKRCASISGHGQFIGIKQDGDERFFLDLVLGDDGLTVSSKMSATERSSKPIVSKELVSLYVVQELIKCQGTMNKKIKDYLAAQHIDTTKVSLGFFGFDPVYIIGVDKAQIWIDMHSFLPVKEKTTDYEVDFKHWMPRNDLSDKKWPSAIITTVEGKEIKLNMTERVSLQRGNNARFFK
jgi:hypothetical protein